MSLSHPNPLSQDPVTIRLIAKADNPFIAQLIRGVFEELDAPREGSAYADPSLDYMFQHYQSQTRAQYFVAEVQGKVVAGCGFGPLPNEPEYVCELQKMYMLPECRGLGIGQKLVEACLEHARQMNYTQCYLETLPNMIAAQKLYQKMGFRYLDQPMGNTGHNNCPVWMLLDM